jgi:hypothetical protein
MTSPLIAIEDIGTLALDMRLRYETTDVEGLDDGDNLSLRIRPSFTSEVIAGFQFMLEGEFTGIEDKDGYNAAGVHGDPGKAVIADPENSQLEQLWLSYTHDDRVSLKLGRQVIAWDGQRWIGHVAWRQNRQTFDAVTLDAKLAEGLNLKYAFIDKVIRIFGDDAPDTGFSEEFGSESHMLNVAYDSGVLGKVTAYAYLVDLANGAGDVPSHNTYGVSVYRQFKGEPADLGLYLEYAYQEDGAGNSLDFGTEYVHARLDAKCHGFSAEVGYELLGADRTNTGSYVSLQTPLATAHKFNGFADSFLVTPSNGLQDYYAMLAYKFELGEAIGPLIAKVWHHEFYSHRGASEEYLGNEFDAVLVKPIPLPIPGKLAFLAKYADFHSPARADIRRTSVELNYALSF